LPEREVDEKIVKEHNYQDAKEDTIAYVVQARLGMEMFFFYNVNWKSLWAEACNIDVYGTDRIGPELQWQQMVVVRNLAYLVRFVVPGLRMIPDCTVALVKVYMLKKRSGDFQVPPRLWRVGAGNYFEPDGRAQVAKGKIAPAVKTVLKLRRDNLLDSDCICSVNKHVDIVLQLVCGRGIMKYKRRLGSNPGK